MEAATLSSPQRKFDAVPVQKSLSLPSYARAGGEGIDHRVIFAALEQREKVRRKSRIFAREKSARQNIFCLPISSGAKCRETSFSSDTSCSSLEYQKPKAATKPKKDETKSSKNESPTVNELSSVKTSQTETKSNPSHKDVAARNVLEGDQDLPQNSLKATTDIRKGHRSPSDTLRPNVNSSDSMERSSRSSNDSLSRKERLVAIKAKVEAAREKYGDTSSEDENRSAITRYNSDGVIHRTVREVKCRSYRMEKRLRRRSQDEYGLKKINRKNNLSLCLNSVEDGIKLDLVHQLNMFEDHPNLECKTDFCPSPNFLEFTKKNYFSDFPSKENMSRMVQARIRQIEEEERKRRNSSDFRDKTKISSRHSPQNMENSSPFSTQRRNIYSNQNAVSSLDMEKNSTNMDILQCSSPVGRAPTPPPRSPKSMTFVNKAYIQHQNSYLNHDSHSLERKPFFQPNIPVTKPLDKLNSKIEVKTNNLKTDILDDTAEKRKMRELFNSRRKTCGYFDYTENFAFKDLSSTPDKTSPKSITTTGTASSSQCSPKTNDTKGYFSSSETPFALPEDPKRRLWKSRWEETEKRHEFMFNSLESKKKAMSPSFMKWSGLQAKNELCLCHVLSGDKSICTCNHSSKNVSNKVSINQPLYGKLENSSNFANSKDFESQQSCSRLSKSEINIAYSEPAKSKIQNLKSDDLFANLQPVEVKSSKDKLESNDLAEKMSATANLDSAMEELESVYRSLKFSSDNLSEKNSASNLSLNDLSGKPSHDDIFNNNVNTDSKFKPSSLKETNLNLYNSKPNNDKLMTGKNYLEFVKSSAYSSPVESATTCKSPDTENLCIDELFNDLTRQLDIEQKLLKESRETRSENRSQDLQTHKCDKSEPKRMTPLESIVSIRKELYDNLQKNSQSQIRPYNSMAKSFDSPQNLALETAKKKYKAVRSLSENISYLMATANTNSAGSRRASPDKSEPSNSSLERSVTEKLSSKSYEHTILEPLKIETKREMSMSQPVVPKRTFMPERLRKHGNEEIRQIRVSMDSNAVESKPIPVKAFTEYPRLSTAVCRPQASNKSETSARLSPAQNVPIETIDVLDESGLEKLLNTLLNDVPDSKQSSLLLSKEDPPATPPPATSAGKCDHVKCKRNILPSKMDAYMAATAKNQVKSTECRQRLKTEEIAQVRNDFRQNNAQINQMSFIPVYSSKTVCHKFPKSKIDRENVHESPSPERKVLSTYSPPTRSRCVPGSSDMITSRFARTHIRRRSVGFEDMTSLSCYGHNFTNDRRFQGSVQNSNIPQSSTENQTIFFKSGNVPATGKVSQSENSFFSSLNRNAELSSGENANDTTLQQKTERPLQRYKDKSSKRKSSLNRIDFIQFPSHNSGSSQFHSDPSRQQNNSSDEECESRFQARKSESPSGGTTKRKHNGNKSNHATSKPEIKTNEVTLRNHSPSKVKSNLLPRSSQMSNSNPKQTRWKPSTIRYSQKLSHSAGELESLTDLSEVPSRNKTYLSAQEYDDREYLRISFSPKTSSRLSTENSIHKASTQVSGNDNDAPSKTEICDNTSHIDDKKECVSDTESEKYKDSNGSVSLNINCDNSQTADQKEDIINKIHPEQIEITSEPPDSNLKLNCDDAEECSDNEVHTSTVKLKNLDISDSSSKTADTYLSADENLEGVFSDSERRPSSILRKKSFEDKKELHSILKQPPEDKSSKVPPSILKHRESSEEKETWQQNDLHSILKKSTSEDESCNSGPDIRPILKLSTDEDSPGGAVRPRPILKKRTSFSDECSYVSFPSGELKPILKKKTPLSSEEQPKPILKSRRKSEDSRSTMSEVVTSRPRAYSADMGVKLSHDSQIDSLEVKKGDFHKLDSHDL